MRFDSLDAAWPVLLSLPMSRLAEFLYVIVKAQQFTFSDDSH